jgi:AhpD family alkylhydroperoxidase
MKTPRVNMLEAAPEAYRALSGVESYIRDCGLEPSLIELVKMRASQINGCAYCLDMHSKDAVRQGETVQRLVLLDGWREASLYTAREQAALGWTDCLTRVATEGAPEAAYAALQSHFSPPEVVNLTTLVGMINLWNRIAIGFHMPHPAAA